LPNTVVVALGEFSDVGPKMVTCANCRAVNPDDARFCSNCGSPIAPPRAIEGERKFATVLFADVARSTAIAEKLDPEDWALIMNGAFAFMNAAVSRYGGTVSRLMGDAVLALFGAPVAHEDDAERAVHAGLDIQEANKTYAASVRDKYGIDFDLRVGINTGTAVLAFVGDAIKTEYTAMGDTANVAARLQSAAQPGTVLISVDTYRLIHAQFDVMPRGAIEAKGKTEPVETYEVVAAKVVPGSSRGLEGLSSPVVGRARETALLREKYAGLAEGRGAVVALIGEAGLGKSRLVADLRHAHANAVNSTQWLEGRAISYGMSIPYYPWRQLGRQFIGGLETDTAPALREKLHEMLKRLDVADNNVPFLETMLAVDTEASRLALATLSGDAVVGGVAAAVVNVVKAAMHAGGETRPQVMVMDDIHWSDTATLELIAQVATLAAFEPLLLVCVLRPDRKAASWSLVDRLQASLGSTFDRIDLEPLDGAHASELLSNLLRIEELPEVIRNQILARSEGNPFYLEEVLRSLIDQGQVVRDGEHWRATRTILDASIPETLAGVLSARIDRLPDATKRVAQTAAVIGRVFQHRVLESVCRAAPAVERIEHVEPHIAALSYEQLVRERAREPEREYSFKHALTCDAAYELLLRSRRRELHARAGAALEQLYPERRDELAGMLAHHFSEAEDPRALAYSIKAAANARRLYALREELMHREYILKALELDPETRPAAKIDAIVEWASVRHRLNDYEGVVPRLEQAIALARASGDKRRLGNALSWMANTHFVMGFPSRSGPFLEESQAIGTELGDEQMVLLPMFFGTWTAVDRDPATSVDRLQEVVDMARSYNVNDVEGHAMAFRAVALARIGEFDRAHAQIDEALAFLPQTRSPVKQADIHIAVGMAYHDMGEYELGLKHARLGAELAEQANGYECACAGYFGVGWTQLERRQLGDAQSQFEKSLRYAGITGFEGFLNMLHGGVALTKIDLGPEAAIEQLRTAVTNAHNINDEYAAAILAEKLAAALLKLGRREEAGQFLGDALRYYRTAGMRPYLASALGLACELHEANGSTGEAAEARAEAAAITADLARQHPIQAEA
jgi:class 3 adenylate cyclase/tetratricopeptide (TPR) repeat protein